MAIEINGSASSSLKSTGTTTTFSHTVASSLSNSILVFCYSSPVVNVTAVTWNGTSMTAGATLSIANYYMAYYYLVNPEAGTYNVVASHSSQATNRGLMGAATFTGVNQSTPINVYGITGGTSASPSTSVTTTVDGCMLVSWIFSGVGASITHGASQTELWNSQDSVLERGTADYKLGGAAGSQTMSQTIAVSNTYDLAVIALAPFVVTGSSKFFQFFN